MIRTSDSPSSRFFPLIAFIASIAILYLAREILIPVILAALLTFLLTPVTALLERWHVGRVPAVLMVLAVTFGALGTVAWVFTTQLVDVVNELPQYSSNIHHKLDAIHGSAGGTLSRVTGSIEQLSKEFSSNTASQIAAPPRRKPGEPAQPVVSNKTPVPVEIQEPQPGALQSLRNLAKPLLAPLSTAFMVIVFTVFMLMNREDLRNRLIRLVARGHLNVVTQAMDDAATRVSRYLRMQFTVNTIFGITIGAVLYVIGVPNAFLWGALAGMLRFIPYIGAPVAAIAPIVLSLAVFDGWLRPALTAALFLFTELLVANVLEPMLYGSHTGISSLAILVAAVFWAVLWGPMGLLVSTPLTVCLLVLGRYVPQLEFLDVLLGTEPVLSPEAQFYQRLLALDQKEARAVMNTFREQKDLLSLYDEVLIPALTMAEEDRHQGALDAQRETFIIDSVNEFILEAAIGSEESPKNGNGQPARFDSPQGGAAAGTRNSRIICWPTSDQADETSAAMLAQILEQAGYSTLCLSASDSALDLLGEISSPGDIICICALPPFALMSARTLSRRLRARFPDLKLIVGLWNYSEGGPHVQDRLGKAFADTVVTSFRHAVDEIHLLEDGGPAPSEPSEGIPGVSSGKEN